MTWPVTQADSSVTSQAISRAGSSGTAQRCCGKCRRTASCASGGAYPVSTGPGLTAFTVMDRSASWSARVRVIEASAPLLAA